MIRLKHAHRGERAAVICGGPSLVEQRFDPRELARRGFVTFVESKALTPGLLHTGWTPDYYLMLFPEKAKDNALQQFVFRSFLANYRIEPMLKRGPREVAARLRERFDDYYESWQPDRPFKRFRWKPDVFLPESPYDLLPRIPGARIIANRMLIERHFPSFSYTDRTYVYEETPEPRFDLGTYFNPEPDAGGTLQIRCAQTFLNSAAIALYPLLNYMGFREVFFLGMDMSMLGSLEYAAPYTFRSMAHFWWFFRRTMRVFNANYRANGWFFKRPQSEFDDLRRLWAEAPLAFARVYEPWRYATQVDGIRTLSPGEFAAQ